VKTDRQRCLLFSRSNQDAERGAALPPNNSPFIPAQDSRACFIYSYLTHSEAKLREYCLREIKREDRFVTHQDTGLLIGILGPPPWYGTFAVSRQKRKPLIILPSLISSLFPNQPEQTHHLPATQSHNVSRQKALLFNRSIN
jgi:hypothetical protein